MSAFEAAAAAALEKNLLNEQQLEDLRYTIEDNRRTESEVTEELLTRISEFESLRAGGMTGDLPAAATAAESRAADTEAQEFIEQGMASMGMDLFEKTMRLAASRHGVDLPAPGSSEGRDWRPEELGCTESDFEGLPARELFLAAKHSRTAELKRLLSAGSALAEHVNDRDGDGFGLLHLISYIDGDPDAIDVIVQQGGGDVDLRNGQFQETALILAAMYGRLSIAERLLEHGARADLGDWHGSTALARAKELGTAKDGRASRKEVGCAPRLIKAIEGALKRQKKDIGSGNRYRSAEAESHRQAGNEAFAAGRIQEAIDAYSRSLEAAEDTRSYANRAACWLKLGLARYRERRVTHGLMHQVCDGEAKIVRWVPDADGKSSAPRPGPPGFAASNPLFEGTYYPFCDGTCSKLDECAFRCRSVEVVTETVGNLYRSAVKDAIKAVSLDPSNAKAHYRLARGHIGVRDFPRARIELEKGLRSCPGNAAMAALLKKIKAMGVGEAFANPLADRRDEHEAGVAAMKAGDAYILCAYCTTSIAGPEPTIAQLGTLAYEGELTKVQVLKRCGFPRSCHACACDPRADIDQRKIRELIES